MTTELQQNRYDAIMRRVGDLKGPGSKVAEVLAEVFPVVELESLPAELFALGGTVLGFGGAVRSPNIGNFGRIQLFNPIDSGKITTVTSANISINTNDGLRWGVVNAALTSGISTQRNRDQRFGFITLPTSQVRTDSTIAAAPATGQIDLLATTPFVLNDPNGLAVLPPGFGFEVSPLTIDIAMRAIFYWRERVAEPSELNL